MNASFQIDGEWLCELARSWFWDENKPYKTAEELLLSALGTDEITEEEKKNIARDILEGRKILVGVNSFVLQEDGKKIRPITDKIKEVQRKLLIKEIQEDMRIHPLNYVDPYTKLKSFAGILSDEFGNYSFDNIYNYFCFPGEEKGKLQPDAMKDLTKEHPDTRCGLWLFDYPELVADTYGKKAPWYEQLEARNFWETMYENKKEDSKDFLEAYQKLKALKRMEEDKDNYVYSMKHPETQKEVIPQEDKHPDDMSSEEYASYLKNLDGLDLAYDVLPDDMKCWEGLVSPKGDFYSCEFGGHNCKAYHLICTYYDQFGFSNRRECKAAIGEYDALDTLIEAGWMATRSLGYIGNYLEYKKDMTWKPTKAQKDTIWEAIVKHDVSVNDVSIIL